MIAKGEKGGNTGVSKEGVGGEQMEEGSKIQAGRGSKGKKLLGEGGE